MATGISVFCRFADGGYGYLQNADVTTGFTGEEILTSNAGNALNQTADVSVGSAFQGRVVTHASMKVVTQNADSATYLWCYFKGADGKIICPIPGGSGTMGQLPPLYKPVRLSTGIQCWGAWQAAGDSATLVASLTVCASDGTCDVFGSTQVDATSTELVNKDSASIGAAMANKTAVQYWGVYPSTLGINNQLGGVSALWVESAAGQITALIPPGDGGYRQQDSVVPAISIPFRINQNDKAYGNTDT